MKKFIGIVLAISVLICTFPCFVINGNAASPIENIFVNGVPLKFSDAEKPFIKEDRTMVPLRAISEALGATVYWIDKDSKGAITKKIQIVRYDTTLRLFIGLPNMDIYKITGSDQNMTNTVTLDSPAIQGDESQDFRTFVPLRAIAEAFNADVNAKFADNDETKIDRPMNVYILDDYDELKENTVSIAELYDTQDIKDSTLISTEGIVSKIDNTYYLQDENESYKMITFTDVPDVENFWQQQLGVSNNNPVGTKVKVTGMVTLVNGNYSMPLKRGITGLRSLSLNSDTTATAKPTATIDEN